MFCLLPPGGGVEGRALPGILHLRNVVLHQKEEKQKTSVAIFHFRECVRFSFKLNSKNQMMLEVVGPDVTLALIKRGI